MRIILDASDCEERQPLREKSHNPAENTSLLSLALYL